MTDRKTAPKIVDAVDIDLHLQPVSKIFLKNNVPVYFIRSAAEEVVNIEWVFNAGNLYEDKHGISQAMCSLLKNGTGTMSAYELTGKIEYYGAFFQVTLGHEIITLTLSALARHLDNLLPIIKEIISDSIFSEAELEIYKQNSLQSLSVNMQKCDYVANILIEEMLFGPNHPYARSKTADTIKSLSRNDLLSFFKEYVANGFCRVFAVGKLPVDFEEKMEELFGFQSFKNDITIPSILVHPLPAKQIDRIVDDNGVQGAVRLGRSFPGYNHPDYKAIIVLNTVFGGYFGSRLMNNIREDKGYTYGIYSYIQSHRDAGAWLISTETGRDVCSMAVTEIYKEMESLCKKKVSKSELSLVKNYLLGIYLSEIDGPFKTISRWKSLILKGFDDNFFYDSIKVIKEISPKDIQLLAQKYFSADEFKEVVVI